MCLAISSERFAYCVVALTKKKVRTAIAIAAMAWTAADAP
jgi:hypothetical protein